MFVATKVGFAYPGVDCGLKAYQIETECEKSLKRLGIESIDLYYAHLDDRATPLDETLAAFDHLIERGKVRFVGASNFRAWRIEEAHWISQRHGWAEYCCVQQRYSYLRPNPGARFDPQVAATEDLLDYCRTRRLTLLAYSPLLKGAYVRADRPLPQQYAGSDTDGRLAVLRSVAVDVGATVGQVVFAWMMQSTPVVIPLLAASTIDQMQENLAAPNVKLSAENLARLNSACTGGAAW
jgi:aryl-alcohol dehydrogenase-like predicted oxidoreductase